MDITREMVEEEGGLSEAGEDMPEEVELRFWDVNPLLCGGGTISPRQVEVFRNTTCTLILFDITSWNSYMAAKEKYYTQSRKISPEAAVILVASKSDLALKMAVEENEVEEFCVKEGILYVFLSTATSMGIDLIENMIKIQILGLLRCNIEGNDLYDIDDLLVIEDGDVEATYFMDHHDDDHYKRSREEEERHIVDEKFIETVSNLAVPDRDFTSISGMVGNFFEVADDTAEEGFWGKNGFKDELDLDSGGATKRDGLSVALQVLQSKVEKIIQHERGGATAGGTQQGDGGNEEGISTGGQGEAWEVKDITGEELNEAFLLLGRRATPSSLGSSNGSNNSRSSRDGGGERAKAIEANAGGRKGRSSQPELRINVGTKGGKTAALEVWEGESEVEAARAFIRRNNLPCTEQSVGKLARQVEACRRKKRQSQSQVIRRNGNEILGRLEVKLKKGGQKRNIVLRVGDDPNSVCRAFATRYNIGREEERNLVGMLTEALAARGGA
ncbi:hypothetical protein TrRE_jg5434 [Triparma retinervis]|uniref:Uncharacterized protein n=1 Tax=Triparma retinervis TaxID=2557542 RepID=A0A9W7C6S1_9STRA|nr:hypothetical protein TrRE_jg5434 [Triparma retinervis]